MHRSKTCKSCGELLPAEGFYRAVGNSDGLTSKCKPCYRIGVSKNRKKRVEQYRAYDVARAKTPARVEKAIRVTKRFRDRYPERFKAQTAVSNAVRRGRLVKQPCEVCGRLDVHGHHDDYTKPLEVRWLCPVHHKEHHERNRPE